MGFWKTERGVGGDAWADALDGCMKQLSKMYVPAHEGENGKPVEAREIMMQEFADLVEFCSRGHLVVEIRHPQKDSTRSLSELHLSSVGTYSNRGQIHC